MSGAKTITFRLPGELRAELEAEIEALQPYMPTISAVMERGLILALGEMRDMRLAKTAPTQPQSSGE